MSLPQSIQFLTGRWSGPSHLWLMPGDPVHESHSTATIETAALGKFARLSYTWEEAGNPQEGMIVFGVADQEGNAEAAWIDSWHMSDKLMVLRGRFDDGVLAVTGSWAAPPGPDWGWRIEIRPGDADTFEMVMYVITPDAEESMAVRASYTRE